jgi:hypothetical protein
LRIEIKELLKERKFLAYYISGCGMHVSLFVMLFINSDLIRFKCIASKRLDSGVILPPKY